MASINLRFSQVSAPKTRTLGRREATLYTMALDAHRVIPIDTTVRLLTKKRKRGALERPPRHSEVS